MPDLFDDTPPQNLGAERAVLSALLNSAYAETAPETLDTVAAIVNPDDFYNDANRRIFRTMLAMRDAGEPIGALALRDRLEKAGELEAAGGEAYLAEIALETALPTHAAHHARTVVDKAKLRKLRYEILKSLSDTTAAGANASSIVRSLSAALEDGFEPRKTACFSSAEWMLAVSATFSAGSETVSSGIDGLDRILCGGFRPGELIIVAARPSVGKTALALGFFLHVAVDCATPTVFYSLEMSEVELGRRAISNRSNVFLSKLRVPEILTRYDSDRIVEAQSAIGDSPAFFRRASGFTLGDVSNDLHRLAERRKIKIAFIDYLGLIGHDDPKADIYRKTTENSLRLKNLAMELQIPIVVLAQLNREAAKIPPGISVEKLDAYRPRVDHLRDSGAIEQDANIVLLLHRPESLFATGSREIERLGIAGEAVLIVAKNRDGNKGETSLHFDGAVQRFTEDGEHEGEVKLGTAPADHGNYQSEFAAFDGRSAAGEQQDREVFDGF